MKAHPTIDPDVKDHTITALNKLIETSKDAEKGYLVAARALRHRHADLAEQMRDYAQQRADFAAELAEAVQTRDARPEKEGHFSAGIHRGWVALRNVLQTGKSQAILREVERGERLALHNYDDALQEAQFENNTQRMVLNQRAQIEDALTHVRDHLR